MKSRKEPIFRHKNAFFFTKFVLPRPWSRTIKFKNFTLWKRTVESRHTDVYWKVYKWKNENHTILCFPVAIFIYKINSYLLLSHKHHPMILLSLNWKLPIHALRLIICVCFFHGIYINNNQFSNHCFRFDWWKNSTILCSFCFWKQRDTIKNI